MNYNSFLESVLNSINEQITVIDRKGNIQFVNDSWVKFSVDNKCSTKTQITWKEVNYLKICDDSAQMGDEFGRNAGIGIRSIIDKKRINFYLEYPCHSATIKRWFMMRVSSFIVEQKEFFTISHQDITERKLAEEKVLHLSRIDGLTNLCNRRYFDEFLHQEWSRCDRLKQPISLALIDIDHFKLLNDTYGHQVGDQCLKIISSVLKKITNRPGDICARFGGEEFVILLSNTKILTAEKIINRLLNMIRDLRLPNKNSPVCPTVTISAGIAYAYPSHGVNEQQLIEIADKYLYQAKENGRNQMMYGHETQKFIASQ